MLEGVAACRAEDEVLEGGYGWIFLDNDLGGGRRLVRRRRGQHRGGGQAAPSVQGGEAVLMVTVGLRERSTGLRFSLHRSVGHFDDVGNGRGRWQRLGVWIVVVVLVLSLSAGVLPVDAFADAAAAGVKATTAEPPPPVYPVMWPQTGPNRSRRSYQLAVGHGYGHGEILCQEQEQARSLPSVHLHVLSYT